MKIEKETLQRYRAQLKAARGCLGLDTNQQRQVVEYCLELIDAADGGPDIAKLRQELAEKENNLKLILADVQESLKEQGVTAIDKLIRARYIVQYGLWYLRERKTKDFQSWKDYRVMVDEEFGGIAS